MNNRLDNKKKNEVGSYSFNIEYIFQNKKSKEDLKKEKEYLCRPIL